MSNLEDMEFDLVWEGKKYRGVWNESIKAFALRIVAPPEQKRCIIRIVKHNEPFGGYYFAARVNSFHDALARAIPQMASIEYEMFSLANANAVPEYCFTILDAQSEHFAWARKAKECGFIDSVLEDYDPNYTEE